MILKRKKDILHASLTGGKKSQNPDGIWAEADNRVLSLLFVARDEGQIQRFTVVGECCAHIYYRGGRNSNSEV